MRIANVAGRLNVLTAAGGIDVAVASGGGFDPEPGAVYERWDELCDWARRTDPAQAVPVDDAQLGAPSPSPRQVFAIGLNYQDHAAEAGFALPDTLPPTFTKWPTCLAGAHDAVRLPSGSVDWEVELVAVIGRRAERVRAEDAWQHVAGITLGQDFSERVVQMSGPVPQFSLGKS